MLTTQADRFSAEEVLCGLFVVNYRYYSRLLRGWGGGQVQKEQSDKCQCGNEGQTRETEWVTAELPCIFKGATAFMKVLIKSAFCFQRWSRCSLPSLLTLQGTLTTRTWFTSSPTERKRTRNRQDFFQTRWRRYELSVIYSTPAPRVGCISVIVQHPPKSRRGSKFNVSLQALKKGALKQHQITLVFQFVLEWSSWQTHVTLFCKLICQSIFMCLFVQ